MERDQDATSNSKKPAGGEAKPATARRKRGKRLVRVDQEIIDRMLKEPPSRPLPVFSDEVLDSLGMPGLGPMMARAAAAMKRSNDRDADILRQYRAKGYAEVEEEVTDDEEDEEEAIRATKKNK